MREKAYNLVNSLNDKYVGYVRTPALLKEGMTNRQILRFQEEGYLEKISNGYFWLTRYPEKKPDDYKAVEVCLVNDDAVIIADSACYYQGLIDVEPPVLSIATRRSDRHKMIMPFDVKRHYLADAYYDEHKKSIKTKFGSYQVYELERSVCECIRFQEDLDKDIFALIIEQYPKTQPDEKFKDRMLAYARRMKFEEKAKKVLT